LYALKVQYIGVYFIAEMSYMITKIIVWC